MVVRSINALNFQKALSGMEQRVVYGELTGQYFDGQVNNLAVNWVYYYLENGQPVEIKKGTKPFNSKAEIKAMYNLVKTDAPTDADTDFPNNFMWACYLALRLEMVAIFSGVNEGLTVEDFEIVTP